MNGHGGVRPGAGGPKGGISQARRLLVGALQGGLVKAGRINGLQGSDEDVAIEAAAHVACDMVIGGRGDEILKLLAISAPKADGGGSGDDADSPVSRALARMPGMLKDSTRARLSGRDEQSAAGSETYEHSATDQQSVALQNRDAQPFFAPQRALPVHAPAETPPPPSRAPRHPMAVGAAPLEKSESGRDA